MLIGVFDSGIGGLTVLKELWHKLPAHSTLYLGDTARVPYGTKSAQTVVRYAQQVSAMLIDQGIDLLVVACNTASAHAMPTLTQLPVPVVGVVEPGARAALEQGSAKHVGVIGTTATVASAAYEQALRRVQPGIRVSSLACPLFVPLVEEGWEHTDVAQAAARRYLAHWADPEADRPDTLVLGCTHYPALKPLLHQLLGDSVRLIDSAEATASVVARRLADAPPEDRPEHRILVTDGAPGFSEIASRLLDRPMPRLDVVDLDPTTIRSRRS